eukprot:CAMPEP_0179068002 /NCGR_PEP_ID=MMETSP0796-20121207/29782_1 /TAXON_ID=73915 /ORGANISM="Pyrodinium bahamense, Strain pbaha01" /LENGTH=181 /DNA_ID=CAMNT_0020765053 /DNA_START=207 /DNA_END=752 /DNA_ORIENTATION=+
MLGVARASLGERSTCGSAEELEIGREYEGIVKEFVGFGALVDLGVDKPGYLHVSKIQEDTIQNVEDVLAINDVIKVRIIRVRRSEVHVSMRDLPLFRKRPLSDFEPGDVVEGNIKTLHKGAIFLDVGAMVDAYLGADQVWDGDKMPHDLTRIYTVGEQVEAKVLESTPNRLSMTLRTDVGV